MNYCPECGNKLDCEDIFCSKCGMKLSTQKIDNKYHYYALISVIIGIVAIIICSLSLSLSVGEKWQVWRYVLVSNFATFPLGMIAMITGFLGSFVGKEQKGSIGFYLGLISIILISIFLPLYW